jgi:hypothetical protein
MFRWKTSCFNSGSWSVGLKVKKAVVELGKVLGENPDISVLMKDIPIIIGIRTNS